MSNNRFAALLEGTSRDPNRKKGFSNQETRPYQRRDRDRIYRTDNYNYLSKSKNSRSPIIPKELFSASDFPDMLASPSKEKSDKSSVPAMNFLNSVQMKEDEDNQIEPKVQLPPGWIELRKNENTINLKANQCQTNTDYYKGNSNFIYKLKVSYFQSVYLDTFKLKLF